MNSVHDLSEAQVDFIFCAFYVQPFVIIIKIFINFGSNAVINYKYHHPSKQLQYSKQS